MQLQLFGLPFWYHICDSLGNEYTFRYCDQALEFGQKLKDRLIQQWEQDMLLFIMDHSCLDEIPEEPTVELWRSDMKRAYLII